jgi:hypothetical protein
MTKLDLDDLESKAKAATQRGASSFSLDQRPDHSPPKLFHRASFRRPSAAPEVRLRSESFLTGPRDHPILSIVLSTIFVARWRKRSATA